MVMVDAPGGLAHPPPTPSRRQHRHDWVRGDIRCLNCARLLGQLLGRPRGRDDGDRSAGKPAVLVAYRPLDPEGRLVPFTPRMRFRCQKCGGTGALDEVEVFSTYDEEPSESGPNHQEEPLERGRGRPARTFLPQRVNGLRAALETL